MQKSVIGVIVAVVAVLGISLVFISGREKDSASETTPTTQTQTGMNNGSPTTQQMATTQMPDGETNQVEMVDFAFTPKKITVKKGTTVTWTNRDSARHDVNPDKDYGDAFQASKLMGKDESYSFTFNTVGTYTYNCSPHPYMKGTVEVTE